MSRAKRIRQLYGEGCDYFFESQDIFAPEVELAYLRFRELDELLTEQDWRRRTVDAQIGFYLAARHLRTGSPDDRDEAIARLLRVTAAPDPDGDLDAVCMTLGQLLADRGMSRTVAERADLTLAVELLAKAARSAKVDPALRAQARAQRVQLSAVLTIFEAWDALAADDPYSPALSLAVGLAIGFRSYASELSADRMRAIDYLADGLEHIDKGNYWRSYALEYLTAMLGRTALTDAD